MKVQALGWTAAVLSLLTVAALVHVGRTAGAEVTAGRGAINTGGPWVGLISPESGQLTALTGTAVRRVVISAHWDAVEPGRGDFDQTALADLRRRSAAARGAGLGVVLDLGLQYPPAWVFALPGATRFVNQYGDVWHGRRPSEDAPNAVYDPAVRAAEADYIEVLGRALGAEQVAAVRVGGLLSGELRYPPAVVGDHADCLWFFDPVAQAASPVPAWRPGQGSASQARRALDYYFASLTRYEVALMRTVDTAFHGVAQQVLFPSWGLRPGMVDAAINAGLHNTTNAERNGMLSAGLDWDAQVRAIARTGIRATVYSTWVDAPSEGSTVAEIPPIAYLVRLARQYGLPVAGENTGGGGRAALALSMERLGALRLNGVMYMSGPSIADGSAGVSLPELIVAANRAVGGR
jgi:hypothetical protein